MSPNGFPPYPEAQAPRSSSSHPGLDGDSIDQYQAEGGEIGSTQLCRELDIT